MSEVPFSIRMKLRIYLVTLFLAVVFPVFSQGLLFHAGDEPINKRTSYRVFENNEQAFNDFFRLSFEMSVLDVNTFGFVCFIQNHVDETSYTLTLNFDADSIYLKMNIPGKQCLISVPLKKNRAEYRKWYPIEICFDSSRQEIVLKVAEMSYFSENQHIGSEFRPNVVFGKHDNYVDVPKIAIRNLRVSDKNKMLHFPLNESDGNDVMDEKGKIYGAVQNPGWLINESYHWKLRCQKRFSQPSVVSFDPATRRFILLDRDSAFIFSPDTDSFSTLAYTNAIRPVIRLGNSFFDTLQHKLFVYEVNDFPENMISIASLNLLSGEWEKVSMQQLPRQRHHHSTFYSAGNKAFTIFGGFGNQRYAASFDRYDFTQDKWTPETFSGDRISPRFYPGQVKIDEHRALLFGGIGNPGGDQTLGRYYYYDCYLIDYQNKIVKKLWEIPLSDTGLVSVRNMVSADSGRAFYTLCYPEYIPNTFLKLYKFSVSDGSYELLGDSVPFVSERIESNANLYYNASSSELYCTTQVVAADSSSVIQIYSLNAPPIAWSDIAHGNVKYFRTNPVSYIILIFTAVSVFIVFLLIRRKNKHHLLSRHLAAQIKAGDVPPAPYRANSIYVFGEFSIIDRRGKNITYLLSPKLKQLFLYILLVEIDNGKGVTSQEIQQAIWADKTLENAKNLRGVALNQIRKMLEEIDGAELLYQNNYFSIVLDDSVYFDFREFTRLLDGDLQSNDVLRQFSDITAYGNFLQEIDFQAILPVKSLLVKKINNLLMPELIRSYKLQNYPTAIRFAKILSRCDEKDAASFHYEIESLLKCGLTNEARKRYNACLSTEDGNIFNLPPSFVEYVDNKQFRIK